MRRMDVRGWERRAIEIERQREKYKKRKRGGPDRERERERHIHIHIHIYIYIYIYIYPMCLCCSYVAKHTSNLVGWGVLVRKKRGICLVFKAFLAF
jgi:hypothetical protein